MITQNTFLSPTIFILAQSTGGLSQLKTGLGTAMFIIMMIAYLIGLVMLISGMVAARRSGGEEGKTAIVWGILIAAAGAIMNAAYAAFGLGSAAVNINTSGF